MVVRLIVEMIRPEEGMHVYDPTCGSGGMLLEAVHHLERQGKNPRSLHLFGQEMNLNTWAICKMNLFLHDIDDVEIARGDTLRDPKHLTPSNTLRRFDRVLANPPFSLKEWGYKEWKNGDRFGRDVRVPAEVYADFAFVQHMVASLKDDGMLGVVLPHGVLFRGGAEGRFERVYSGRT
jgi:type I restriction enzyme M protein